MSASYHSYLLIDGALAGEDAVGQARARGEGLDWLHSSYPDSAAPIGPLIVDIGAAFEAGDTDLMMRLASAVSPQLHVAIIHTDFSASELVEHLRQFLVIRSESHENYSLRFADCVALANLVGVLSPSQWQSLVGPVLRWQIHGRDGRLLTLPQPDRQVVPAQTPLVVSADQFAQLREAEMPDVILSSIREMRHGEDLPGSCWEQYRWAKESKDIWKASGNPDAIVLRWLTTAMLDTHGEIRASNRLQPLLAGNDHVEIRSFLARCEKEAVDINVSSPANVSNFRLAEASL